jgi:hypothetical protein
MVTYMVMVRRGRGTAAALSSTVRLASPHA